MRLLPTNRASAPVLGAVVAVTAMLAGPAGSSRATGARVCVVDDGLASCKSSGHEHAREQESANQHLHLRPLFDAWACSS